MENANTNPSPPGVAGLIWRQIAREDLAALVELAGACHQADGGIGFMFEPDILESRYFPGAPGAATGAFAPDGRLAACAAVHTGGDPSRQPATIVGHVRPDLRNRGTGAYLMKWSQAQAESLLADVTADQRVLQISTEALTEPANRLYRAHGFVCVFEELVMERDLHRTVPDRALPQDVTITDWQPDLAGQFFQAYHAAFQERPGFPGWSANEWISRVTGNNHKPEWSLLARAGGLSLGFVIGNIDLTTDPPGGHVWQIGVVPAGRRRGLASALLAETMRRMKAAGATSALLAVHTNNPGAIQAYAGLGFVTTGRRARYERVYEQ